MNPIQLISKNIFTQKVKVNEKIKVRTPRKVFHWGRLNKYPVLCVIFEKRGSSYIVDFDWAGYFKSPKSSFYRLKKRKANFMPPKLQQVKMSAYGMPVMILWSPSRGQYIPRDITESPKLQEILDQETQLRYWGLGELERVRNKSQGFLTKYFVPILFVFLVIIALIGIWVLYDALGQIVMQFSSTVGGLQGAINHLANSTIVNGSSNLTPPTW